VDYTTTSIYGLCDPCSGMIRYVGKADDVAKRAKERCANPRERERLRSISNGTPPVRKGEANNKAKLSAATVSELRERFARGEEAALLADEFDLTSTNVWYVVTGRTWKHVGGPIAESKPRSFLTDQDKAEMRSRFDNGEKQSVLAKAFGTDPSHVSRIVRNEIRPTRTSRR